MKYISTRGKDKLSSSFEAIVKGIASDGGLFMPEKFNKVNLSQDIKDRMDYRDFAEVIISTIFDDIDKKILREIIDKAYSKENFSVDNALKVEEVNSLYIMELFHGRTSAFKDFALSILPYFILLAKDKDKKIGILTATSGDTGKAALEGFKNLKDTFIIVFYPTDGVSPIQKYQMLTQEGTNVYAIGIKGNFDQAQSALKDAFNDKELRDFLESKNILLSSANSINIGRLVPQIVYYFYAYYDLVKKSKIKDGEEINVAVPTGNFGNILAAYLAKVMGLNIGNFIVASNKNNVLTDFFNSGIYNANREFYKTNSPSMDILISSNLERLLYLKAPEELNSYMESLKNKGTYKISDECRKSLKEFKGYYAEDDEALEIIKKYYKNFNYLCDTHTAVCLKAVEDYLKENDDNRKILLASTASFYKFPASIGKALNISGSDDFKIIENINKITNIPIPENLKNLDKKEILQNIVIDKEYIKKEIMKILGDNDEN